MYRDGYGECMSRERDLNLRSFASTVQEIRRSRELPRKPGGMPRTVEDDFETSSQVTASGKFCYSPLILNECFTNAKVAKLPFDKIEFLKRPCGSPMQQSPFKLTLPSQAMARICSICQPTRAISSRKTL